MKITDYLAEQSRSLEQTSKRVKEFRVFDFNYIPSEPLMRNEAKPIIDACLRYLATGIPNHLFIFGSRGCGKTLMVKYIAQLLAHQHAANVQYVNCRQHNTSFKILAHLLGVRPRGHSLDELWLRFCADHPDRMLLVLDEVDLISDKDRRKDILYLLSRASVGHMAILLSNHPKFLQGLDESIRSTLQPELIHFRNYDALQIFEILRDRARIGLVHPPWNILSELAALTASTTNSDVRVAIKALYHIALEGGRDLKAVFERARRDLVNDVLADLNPRNLLILKAATETREPFVKAVYDRYRQMSRACGEEPFSYVYFYTSLSYLQSIGLIVLVSTKVGRAYTNCVRLLLDLPTFGAVWRARWE